MTTVKIVFVAYVMICEFFPDQIIIVFRDGVSGVSSVEHLQHSEILQMKLAIDEVCRGTVFTFCVVQKRINERIFSPNVSEWLINGHET